MNYSDLGFTRVAAIQPPVDIADPERNARTLSEWATRAAGESVSVAAFPELAITAYTCEDLFHSEALLEGAREGLATLAQATSTLPMALVVGAPYRTQDGRLYNCAFVLARGAVRGAVPKTYLANYGEFYERRWFVPGTGVDLTVQDSVLGTFRLGTRQLFSIGRVVFAVEICEDLWAPIPMSSEHALRGANVIVNLSASNDWVAKADYRRELVKQQSARLNACYLYTSCGPTESTKDVVYGGHGLIAENGALLAESKRFETKGSMIVADIDVEKLAHDRSRNTTFGASAIPVTTYSSEDLGAAAKLESLHRQFSRTPFVPADPATVNERAQEILHLQAAGLARRLLASRSETAVIGVSGGLDSTLALLVSVEAMRRLGRPATNVLGISMPGFGTTGRTRTAASALSSRLGITFREIPITAVVEQHFRDIGHDPQTHDVVFENAQARERTQILFDLANKYRGIVVGTGDLSELALGWCTYNADHMSNYAVNASVPKTLVKHLVRWWADHVADVDTREVLSGILATPISPELLPPTKEGVQSTEKAIGPYELHDFFLFHSVRNGYRPRKLFELSRLAFEGTYDGTTIRKWLRVFVERFCTQQFKRTCIPAGPKIGSVSLSPRGDWRMPDEVDPRALLAEVDAL